MTMTIDDLIAMDDSELTLLDYMVMAEVIARAVFEQGMKHAEAELGETLSDAVKLGAIEDALEEDAGSRIVMTTALGIQADLNSRMLAALVSALDAGAQPGDFTVVLVKARPDIIREVLRTYQRKLAEPQV